MRTGVDPSESARKYADRLLDVHIKDVTAATAKGSTCEVGRGVIDIPKFVRTLVDIDYAGIVAFEYEKDENDPMPGLAESVGHVRGVMALSLIHISEPTRLLSISYAVFCLKKKKQK